MDNCNCTNTGFLGKRWPFEWEFDFPSQIAVTIGQIDKNLTVVCSTCENNYNSSVEATYGDYRKCSNNRNTRYCPECVYGSISSGGGLFCSGTDCDFNVNCNKRCGVYQGTYILSQTTPGVYTGNFQLGLLFTVVNPQWKPNSATPNVDGWQSYNIPIYAYISLRVVIPSTPMSDTCYATVSFVDPHLECWYQRFGYSLKIQYNLSAPFRTRFGAPGVNITPDLTGFPSYATTSSWLTNNLLTGISRQLYTGENTNEFVFRHYLKFDIKKDNEFKALKKGKYCTIPSISVTGV